MIDVIKAIILGIIQGLTEFLPISSSGHLILGQYFLDFEMPGVSFEVMLHLGTLFAVVIFFHKDILQIVGSYFTVKTDPVYSQRRKIGLLLLISTIITGGLYFLFRDTIENLFETESRLNLYIVCIFLSVSGFMNFISDKITKDRIAAHELSFGKAAIIGLGQAFALNPGISRSGATITFGLLVGLNRKQVATYSFLLSVPAILGATMNEIPNLASTPRADLKLYLIGAFAAFVTGFMVISFLIRMLQKRKMKVFAYWCWLFAAFSAVYITLN